MFSLVFRDINSSRGGLRTRHAYFEKKENERSPVKVKILGFRKK